MARETLFDHPGEMRIACKNATADEIEGEKSSIATRRAKALEVAKVNHKTVVALSTARRAVAQSQLRNTLAHEAMEAAIAGMRAAKLARDKARASARRR